MSIKNKITAGMATAAMMATIIAPVSHAATITGNGPFSKNVVVQVKVKATGVHQSNTTIANTFVVSRANTGKNNSSFSVGGASTQTTGPATSNVVVGVTGGSNVATVSNCGCDGSPMNASITGNGPFSWNAVVQGNVNVTHVSQSNTTVANTTVISSANTGGNNSSFNVGAGSTQTTNPATSSVAVGVEGSDNTATQ